MQRGSTLFYVTLIPDQQTSVCVINLEDLYY